LRLDGKGGANDTANETSGRKFSTYDYWSYKTTQTPCLPGAKNARLKTLLWTPTGDKTSAEIRKLF
jgi:hypothetical protein